MPERKPAFIKVGRSVFNLYEIIEINLNYNHERDTQYEFEVPDGSIVLECQNDNTTWWAPDNFDSKDEIADVDFLRRIFSDRKFAEKFGINLICREEHINNIRSLET